MRDDHVFKESFVERMKELKAGWDSYGAPPIGRGAIDALFGAYVVPTSRGGLQIEWHTSGWDIEIEFNSDGTVDTVMVGKA